MLTQAIIDEAKQQFQKILIHLKQEFSQIQAGRANPAIVENVLILAYGNPSPLKNLASITIPEPQSITISPWDKFLLSSIEKAIRDSDIGINPINDGSGSLRINIPPLTEERRRELVKVVHTRVEDARVAVRNSRHDSQHKIRTLDVSEDEQKKAEKDLQEEVDKTNKNIDELAKNKETDVMKV